MTFTPVQILVAVPFIVMFILVFYFSGKIARIKLQLSNANKMTALASEDMADSMSACGDLNKALKDYRVVCAEFATTTIARNIYLELSLFRETYGVWELNSETYEYHIEEVLAQLLYYKSITLLPEAQNFNEMLKRAQRLAKEKWVQESFMERIQHPDFMDSLTDNSTLASEDLYLMDECIRIVLMNYPEENPTVPVTKYIRC